MSEKKIVKTKIRLKRGDQVRIIAGKDKGKDGKVLLVDRKDNRIIVEGINMMTKHMKPTRTNQKGGIIRKEAPIHASNVMYLHKGTPTRIGYRMEEMIKDGVTTLVKQRVAVSTGEVID